MATATPDSFSHSLSSAARNRTALQSRFTWRQGGQALSSHQPVAMIHAPGRRRILGGAVPCGWRQRPVRGTGVKHQLPIVTAAGVVLWLWGRIFVEHHGSNYCPPLVLLGSSSFSNFYPSWEQGLQNSSWAFFLAKLGLKGRTIAPSTVLITGVTDAHHPPPRHLL